MSFRCFPPETEGGREVLRLFQSKQSGDSVPLALQRMAELLAVLPMSELIALGFNFESAEDDNAFCMVHGDAHGWLPGGTVWLYISPGRTQRVMSWAPDDEPNAWLWVDGRVLDVPLESDGKPSTAGHCHWVSDHLFALEVTVDRHHPLQRYTPGSILGTQAGLLLADMETGRRRIEYPRPDEVWSSPWAQLRDGRFVDILIGPVTDRRVVRSVPIEVFDAEEVPPPFTSGAP